MSVITPQILKGTRDFLPEEMAKRDFVMDKIRSVFCRFGYDAIDTPAIEYAETLLGKYGEEGSKLLYRFQDNGGRDIALRYDQTVPFARVVAQYYNELPMPFKRYQISKVWRGDKPAKGRYREFTQCDIDIVGTNSLVAEAEVAKVITDVFAALGLGDNVVIQVNSRKLITSIMERLGIPTEDQNGCLRSLDKLEKIGVSGVTEELTRIISPDAAKKLLVVVSPDGSNRERLDALAEYDTAQVVQFLDVCRMFGIPEQTLQVVPSMARGLDYYTGIIYEVYLSGVSIGAVCAGGRYDNLCGMFSSRQLSGVGVAFGFDRIMLALDMQDRLLGIRPNAKILVAQLSVATLPASLALVSELQAAGINTEIYFAPVKLEKQLKFALKKRIPFLVLCGEDEIRDNSVTIKDLQRKKQKTIPRVQLVEYFNGYTTL